MQERLIKVRNRAGIHCRPSGVILNAIRQEFPDHRFSVVTAEVTSSCYPNFWNIAR